MVTAAHFASSTVNIQLIFKAVNFSPNSSLYIWLENNLDSRLLKNYDMIQPSHDKLINDNIELSPGHVYDRDSFLKWKLSDKLSRPCLSDPADKAVGKTASWTVCQSAPRRAPSEWLTALQQMESKSGKSAKWNESFHTHFPPRLLRTPHWLRFLCQAIWLTVAWW